MIVDQLRFLAYVLSPAYVLISFNLYILHLGSPYWYVVYHVQYIYNDNNNAYVLIHNCICMYVNIYIYTWLEREKDTHTHVCASISTQFQRLYCRLIHLLCHQRLLMPIASSPQHRNVLSQVLCYVLVTTPSCFIYRYIMIYIYIYNIYIYMYSFPIVAR